MRSKNAFPTLRAEMARHEIAIVDIAQLLGIRRETVYEKLAGKQPIRLEEAFRISALFPAVPVLELFQMEER